MIVLGTQVNFFIIFRKDRRWDKQVKVRFAETNLLQDTWKRKKKDIWVLLPSFDMEKKGHDQYKSIHSYSLSDSLIHWQEGRYGTIRKKSGIKTIFYVIIYE